LELILAPVSAPEVQGDTGSGEGQCKEEHHGWHDGHDLRGGGGEGEKERERRRGREGEEGEEKERVGRRGREGEEKKGRE